MKWIRAAAIMVVILLVPAIAVAATGSFSSSTSTTALSAKNSGSGKAINAVSNTNLAGLFTRNATSGTTPALEGLSKSRSSGSSAVLGYATGSSGTTYGVYGRSNSPTGRGVYGLAANTGAAAVNYGVYGQSSGGFYGSSGVFGRATSCCGAGVRGESPNIGVLGFGPGIGVMGDGAVWGVYSGGDLGIEGNIVASFGVTGKCTVASGTTSKDCTFGVSLPAGVAPYVTVTPYGNPGSFFWVTLASLPTTDGFTINLAAAPAGDVEFRYIVIGNPE